MDSDAASEHDRAEVPGFDTGGRVERTGIALVHEGEYILPAPGSEARLSGAGNDTVVNYHFPIEIEVIGAVDDAVVAQIAQRVFAELDRELSSRL
jgi:hypothetical protein